MAVGLTGSVLFDVQCAALFEKNDLFQIDDGQTRTRELVRFG